VPCDPDEDIARYQRDFGSSIHAMTPMMGMMNPQVMSGMRAMNPG